LSGGFYAVVLYQGKAFSRGKEFVKSRIAALVLNYRILKDSILLDKKISQL